MKTLRNYIAINFLTTFLSTVFVFTFVISIGGLFKLTDLMAHGVSPGPILVVFLTSLPSALAFAIPISSITATLLIFGRLSADSEISAMKACGISLWRITGWMIPLALLLLLVCIYIHSELVPKSHFASRVAMAELRSINPVDLIEEGRVISDFEGLNFYVGRKKGNVLENIRIFDQREKGRLREIKAERGLVSVQTNSNAIVLSLEQVTVDPFSFDRPGKADATRWSIVIDKARRDSQYRLRDKDLTLVELYMGAQSLKRGTDSTVATNTPVARSGSRMDPPFFDRRAMAMKMMVEFHKRLALSGASFAFVMLGIPLGIRSHRKESSMGIGLGLVFVFLFYMFILLAEQLASRPEWHPDLLSWIPVGISLLLSAYMIRRLN